MKNRRLTQVFLTLMGIAFCKVGIEALLDPQSVLRAVGITLTGASAFSSMRTVYGGLHLVLGLYCLTGILRDPAGPLRFVMLYTIGFAIGRLSGLMVEGVPNEFVITWFITEVISGVFAGMLLLTTTRHAQKGEVAA